MSTTTAASPLPFPRVLHIQDPDGPHIFRASDHRAEPVKWLWPNRIPLGSITLLAGDPGTGKSLFAIDLAARVSTGSSFPDLPLPSGEGRGEGAREHGPQSWHERTAVVPPSPPGSVLILSASDSLHDTILPRLDAAGADSSRVFVLGNITNLRADMEKLRLAIDATPDLRLLVIDPINFYVGPGDAHFQTVVRTVLEPLAQLARERQFAILALTHFRKNDGAALQRAAGSMGFVATARAIWTIQADAEDPARRYFLPVKNNLTAPVAPLAFQITSDAPAVVETAQVRPPHVNPQSAIRNPQSPHLTWDPSPIDAATLARPSRPAASTTRTEAEAFLKEALADGPRPASDLIALANDRGLPKRTVQRAFHTLAGHTRKKGFRAGWWWSLGQYPIAPLRACPAENPLVEPTYATDVAEEMSMNLLMAGLGDLIRDRPDTPSPAATAPPDVARPAAAAPPSPAQPAAAKQPDTTTKNVAPSADVSPSPESPAKRPAATEKQLSPSSPVSPSGDLSPSPTATCSKSVTTPNNHCHAETLTCRERQSRVPTGCRNPKSEINPPSPLAPSSSCLKPPLPLNEPPPY